MASDKFTKLNVIAMQIQGLWPVASFGWKAGLLHRTFGVLITLSYGLFTATMFVDIVISRDNMEAVIGNLSVSLLYFSGMAKATVFLFTGHRMYDLVEHAEKFSHRIRQSGDAKSLRIFNEYVRHANRVTVIFWAVAGLTITGFCGAPLIDVVAGIRREPAQLIWSYPLVIILILSTSIIKFFWECILRSVSAFEADMWSGYLLQLSMAYLTGIITASWSTLMAVLIIIPTCELKTLGVELEGMVENQNSNASKGRDLNARIESWVKRHLDVIRYTVCLDQALNHLQLLDFVIYSGIFCCIFFKYIVMGFKYDTLVASLYMLSVITLLMIIHWPGNELQLSSGSLADAAYNSIWYRAPASYRTSIKIIMFRCRRPQKLRVWKLYDTSTTTILKITSTAYSYFAILRHIYLKE